EVLTQASDLLERSGENPRCPIPWDVEEFSNEIRWNDLPLSIANEICAKRPASRQRSRRAPPPRSRFPTGS
ncbi:MAG TPA: hypothetical protein VGE98_00210, partial [Thermoanaerobaculia bacterium]